MSLYNTIPQTTHDAEETLLQAQKPKTNLKALVGGAAAASLVLGLLVATAVSSTAARTSSLVASTSNDQGVLYVQNARSLTLTSSSMTLEGLDKHTTWFTDRPERKAGKVSSQAFFDVWNKGDDSFGKVNPNAALVCMRGSEVIEHVVTLSRPDYSAENDDVTYNIEYVDATGPADTETCTSDVSLFIDSSWCSSNAACAHAKAINCKFACMNRDLMSASTCMICKIDYGCLAWSSPKSCFG